MIDYTTIGNITDYDISIENHNSGSVNLSSGSWQETYRSTIGDWPAGTILLVQAYATFSGNTTGSRGIVIRTTSTDAASTFVRSSAESGSATRISTSWTMTMGATSTMGVAAYQNSGSSLQSAVYCRIIVLTPKHSS